MDTQLFVQNIKLYCQLRGIKPTVACRESGAGSNLLSNIEKGSAPSVFKIQQLASYLKVTTSELLGEARRPTPEDGGGQEGKADPLRSTLLHNFERLNQEGQERLVVTSDDMVSSGKYIKTGTDGMGKKA